MPSNTPLTDAINALTQYANETTGASDTTLSDAVGTLVAGYGGGGSGTSIGIQNTQIPNILNMFYALEHGTAVTGEFTLAQAIPNTSTEILDTGLSTVHGLMIVDESQDTLNTGGSPENLLFGIAFNPGATTADYSFYRTTSYMEYGTNANGVNRGFFPRVNSWEVTNGKLYVTAAFNRNDTYTPFHSGHTYRWVAW